jgi:hypothetical protein
MTDTNSVLLYSSRTRPFGNARRGARGERRTTKAVCSRLSAGFASVLFVLDDDGGGTCLCRVTPGALVRFLSTTSFLTQRCLAEPRLLTFPLFSSPRCFWQAAHQEGLCSWRSRRPKVSTRFCAGLTPAGFSFSNDSFFPTPREGQRASLAWARSFRRTLRETTKVSGCGLASLRLEGTTLLLYTLLHPAPFPRCSLSHSRSCWHIRSSLSTTLRGPSSAPSCKRSHKRLNKDKVSSRLLMMMRRRTGMVACVCVRSRST